MKKITVILFFCGLFSTKMTFAQSHEIQQLLLNVEKLAQFKEILQQMYDYYKMVEEGYNKVRDVASGNFKIHELFLDGLMAVNPEIKKYQKVADIVQLQIIISKEYKSAYRMFASCNMFNEKELRYIYNTYENLLAESLKNLDALLLIITSGKLRMSDDERIKAIDSLYMEMNSKLEFLRAFNGDNHILALQRLQNQAEIKGMRSIHGIE